MNFTEIPKTKRLNYGMALKHKFVSVADVQSLISSARNTSHPHYTTNCHTVFGK